MVCLSRGGTVLKKLFLDFSLDGAAVNPYMGCRWSESNFYRLDWLDTSWRMLGASDSCQAVHLVERGRSKASCNSSANIIKRAESIFPA